LTQTSFSPPFQPGLAVLGDVPDEAPLPTPSGVSGELYNDSNGNGNFDAGEPGLQGWEVDVWDSNGNFVASELTDANGDYDIEGLGPGTYRVTEVVPPGWVETEPTGGYYVVNVTTGANITGLVFGDHASSLLNPVAVIDNIQPGYSETGSWSTVVRGYNDTSRVARTLRPSGQSATATWTFTGLPKGTTYFVYVTYAGKSTYSTAAPFSANGGTAVKVNESILVTQSQGLAQGSYGGVGWVEVGNYAASAGGSLKVVLSNFAAGNYVDADAVLIVPDGSAAAVLGGPTSRDGGAPVETAMGTVPTNGVSGGQTTGAPTLAMGDVTEPAPVTVVHNSGPPAQGNTPSVGIVDLAIGSLTEEGCTTTRRKAGRD
jgi:hypothetical protein